MRFGLLAVIVLAAGTATPALAAKHHAASTPVTAAMPTFDDCFRLAWVRGVHVERDELGAFNEDCLANRVPFDSGYSATTIKREPAQPEYRIAKTATHKVETHKIEKNDLSVQKPHEEEESHGSEAGGN